MQNIFITGNSQGLGLGLTRYYLQQGDQVYSLSRSACPLQGESLHHRVQDLGQLDQIDAALDLLLPGQLDLVILNAGILGQIKDLADTTLDELRQIMDINVWANKVIIDHLIKRAIPVRQLILVSSGAAINGNRGWGGYAISKASLNMLAQLYAHEMPETHLTALAPGLIHTRMQDYLCHDVDRQHYPSIERLAEAYGSEAMPEIDAAAERIARCFGQCLDHESGRFVDLRRL